MVMVAEAHMPMTLYVPGLTDAEFQNFCVQYADFRIEYTAEGELLVMPPTDPTTSGRNLKIIKQLAIWAEGRGGGIATDSSGGFLLPDGSRLSPDGAWISFARLAEQPMCPEFVIELRSPSDRMKKLQDKMLVWIANGAELGWLIDPEKRSVTIYRSGGAVETFQNADAVQGEGCAEGFVLDLKPIWNPY